MGQESGLPGQNPCRGRILVVDDNSVNREVMRATLEPSGFAVTLAGSVREGLALAQRETFDLILSDLHMPGEDGLKFLRAVQGDPQLRSIPFLLITASVWGDRDRPLALSLGARRYLLRPVEPEILLEEIRACLPPGG